MESTKKVSSNLEAIAWGALFVWWGVTALIESLPTGTGLVGIGLILLGLNAARHFNGIAMSGFTTALGILALVWGGLELAGTVIHLPFELPVFAIFLFVLGLLVIVRELKGNKNQ